MKKQRLHWKDCLSFFSTSLKKIEAICFRYNQNQDYHIKCRPEKQNNMLHKPLTICSFSLRIYVSRLPCLYTITQNILPKLLMKASSCYKSYDLQIAYFKKIWVNNDFSILVTLTLAKLCINEKWNTSANINLVWHMYNMHARIQRRGGGPTVIFCRGGGGPGPHLISPLDPRMVYIDI